jgi:hypothetical protein
MKLPVSVSSAGLVERGEWGRLTCPSCGTWGERSVYRGAPLYCWDCLCRGLGWIEVKGDTDGHGPHVGQAGRAKPVR